MRFNTGCDVRFKLRNRPQYTRTHELPWRDTDTIHLKQMSCAVLFTDVQITWTSAVQPKYRVVMSSKGECTCWFYCKSKSIVSWALTAAQNGCAASQYRIAREYEFGECKTAERKSKSLQWYVAAANSGHAAAAYELSLRYFLGKGVDEDKTAARGFLLMAANGNHLQALLDLANQSDDAAANVYRKRYK